MKKITLARSGVTVANANLLINFSVYRDFKALVNKRNKANGQRDSISQATESLMREEIKRSKS